VPSAFDPDTIWQDGLPIDKALIRSTSTGLGRLKTEVEGVLPDGSGFVSADAGNELATNPKFWVGTQTEYDAIGSPDANTIYLVVA
jgi:hypothetical protein